MMTVKRKAVKIAAIFIMIAMAIVLHIAPEFNSGWLLASKSYIDLGMVRIWRHRQTWRILGCNGDGRSGSAGLDSATAFWLVDRFREKNDLCRYLLHGFFIQSIRNKMVLSDRVLDILGLAVIAAFIVILFSLEIARCRLGQPFIEGKASIVELRMQRKHGHV